RQRHLRAEHMRELDDFAGLDQLHGVEHALRLHVIGGAAFVAGAPFRGTARAVGGWRPRWCLRRCLRRSGGADDQRGEQSNRQCMRPHGDPPFTTHKPFTTNLEFGSESICTAGKDSGSNQQPQTTPAGGAIYSCDLYSWHGHFWRMAASATRRKSCAPASGFASTKLAMTCSICSGVVALGWQNLRLSGSTRLTNE